MIDHTLLNPAATQAQIRRLCNEARTYGFAAVCVNPSHAERGSTELIGSEVATCVVIEFPLGATLTEVKVCEALCAVERGAREIDMVINIGALKDGRQDMVRQDIQAVVQAIRGRALVKAIIECCLLSDDEKVRATQAALDAGAAFVKTSTGLSTGGATLEDVRLLCRTVGERALVKASGGIRDYPSARALVDAGASRIGTSAGVRIVTQALGPLP